MRSCRQIPGTRLLSSKSFYSVFRKKMDMAACSSFWNQEPKRCFLMRKKGSRTVLFFGLVYYACISGLGQSVWACHRAVSFFSGGMDACGRRPACGSGIGAWNDMGGDWDRSGPAQDFSRSRAADVFIDTNLKMNGIADGKISYSRVVRLLLQYYRQQSALLQ